MVTAVAEDTVHRGIFFAIDQDGDGYPSVGEESVWSEETHEGQFIIDNIPFCR